MEIILSIPDRQQTYYTAHLCKRLKIKRRLSIVPHKDAMNLSGRIAYGVGLPNDRRPNVIEPFKHEKSNFPILPARSEN